MKSKKEHKRVKQQNYDPSLTQKRLRSLIDEWKEKGISRVDIAHSPELDCETSTITKHCNGDRAVNSRYIVGYAKYFGVTTDYLLGLTNIKYSSNTDFDSIRISIDNIQELITTITNHHKELVSILSKLIE